MEACYGSLPCGERRVHHNKQHKYYKHTQLNGIMTVAHNALVLVYMK